MHWRTKKRIKDAAAIGIVATTSSLLVRQASLSNGALRRAGRNALISALAVGPVAGGLGFADYKLYPPRAPHDIDEALETTVTWGALASIVAGVTGAVTSLTRDALRGSKRI